MRPPGNKHISKCSRIPCPGSNEILTGLRVFLRVFRVDWKPELTDATIFAKIQLSSSNRLAHCLAHPMVELIWLACNMRLDLRSSIHSLQRHIARQSQELSRKLHTRIPNIAHLLTLQRSLGHHMVEDISSGTLSSATKTFAPCIGRVACFWAYIGLRILGSPRLLHIVQGSVQDSFGTTIWTLQTLLGTMSNSMERM